MKAMLQLSLGDDLLTIESEITNVKDLFKFHSMFADIPKQGPNGEDDLHLYYRKTKEGYEYYSVVSPKAGMEFEFGQAKIGGELFPKGWVKIQRGHYIEGVEQETTQAVAAGKCAQVPARTEAATQIAGAPSSPPKTEAQRLGDELSQLLWKTLIVESTKQWAGDFLFALLDAPKAQASVNCLTRGIAAANVAVKQPAMLEWAAAKWRYESDSKASLTTKMHCLGLMVRYLGEAGDFQDLMSVIGGDPSKKSADGIKKMLSNLKSWFEVEAGALTDKDIGF
jgi:hypothetical protein